MSWTSKSVVLHLIAHFQALGAKAPEWVSIAPWQDHLVLHCQAKAAGRFILGLCEGKGWSTSSHYRRLGKSGQIVADSLNLQERCRNSDA